MNNVHDLGGMQAFGPVNPEPETGEPVFHAEWERRVFAVTLASGAAAGWSLDASRHTRESLPPALYLTSSYYEIWLEALTRQLIGAGLISAAECQTGQPDGGSNAPPVSALLPEAVAPMLAVGKPSAMDSEIAPRFSVGDRVRVVNAHPRGHTRATRYARGRIGIVAARRGVHLFADKSAHGIREGQHLYNIRFSAQELWGAEANARDSVNLDLWDDHLEPAPEVGGAS